MDETTRVYFESMVSKIDGVSDEIKSIKKDNKVTNEKVNHIENLLTKHISYNQGLDVKMRLAKNEEELAKRAVKTEEELSKKASVSGLKWVAVTFFAALSGVVGVIGLIK